MKRTATQNLFFMYEPCRRRRIAPNQNTAGIGGLEFSGTGRCLAANGENQINKFGFSKAKTAGEER
jgi:hypothetical protein